MSIANRLYDVPHGIEGGINASDIPGLYIDGALSDALAGEAYEGRLQIHNAVGACTVKLLSGDLPNGATVTCDNSTSEVVIKWPRSSLESSVIPNSGFGEGDDGSWEKGSGWKITTFADADGTVTSDPNDPNNTGLAQYYNQTGESDIISTFKAPVGAAKELGLQINASCDVVQGETSSNQAGAGVRVIFEDAVGNRVGVSTGNIIENSDEPTNQGWKVSSLVTNIPANAVYARLGASAFRNHQNRALWIDNLTWNLLQNSIGTDTVGPVTLSIEVKDSYGRVAYWSGIIQVVSSGTIVGDVDFNEGTDGDVITSVTDSTGREWIIESATITDRWNENPVVVPIFTSQYAKEGLSMLKVPDTANHDGTYDYTGGGNQGIYTTLGDDAISADEDFCFELFVRLNAHFPKNNDSRGFMVFYTNNGRWILASRLNSTSLLEHTNTPSSVTRTIWTPPNISPDAGTFFHHAICRIDDTISTYYNGVKYAEYTGGSSLVIDSTHKIVVGNGDGSIASSLGWPGQFDNIRLTKGYARYSEDFTPPTPPY